MICAPDKALEIATRRPNSQVVLLFITDDFSVVDVELRERLAKKLLQAGVPVYGLITKRNFFMDYGVSLFGVVGVKMPGKRRANAVQYLAEETGGEAVRVRDPAKYAETFGRLIDSLAARYTLGFTLGEDEADDGRMHRLEVKVKARDARGKARKLIVYARRGYYVPKEPTGSKVSEEKP
jgi:cell division ATPase FtsA